MKKFKEKVLRDPIYGNISVHHPLLTELIDSPPFQRLRRIRQLGMCFSVFHGAEHSRFQHAVGTMWLMHRILKHWQNNKLLKTKNDLVLAAEAAALLHDIGHGPFSHALEHAFSSVDHETLGQNIVRLLLAPIFGKYGIDPEITASIMNGSYPDPIYHELLSSQLDVDRMDYLQRDSLFTGAKYGIYDIDRIIYTIRPFREPDGRHCCAVDRKGCEAVEGYIFCRYFMHWQVYLHKTVRSYETLLRKILERSHELYRHDPDSLEIPANLRFLFESPQEKAPTGRETEQYLRHYIQIDDFDFYHTLKLWMNNPDPVLSDLAERFLNRRPFKAFDDPGSESVKHQIINCVKKEKGDVWQWYYLTDTPQNLGYTPYQPGKTASPIRILNDPPTDWKEISQAGRTRAIESLSEPISRPLIMIPHSCYHKIEHLLKKERPYQSSIF